MGCKQSKTGEPISIINVDGNDGKHYGPGHHMKATNKPEVHFDRKLDPQPLPSGLGVDHGVIRRHSSSNVLGERANSARSSQRVGASPQKQEEN